MEISAQLGVPHQLDPLGAQRKECDFSKVTPTIEEMVGLLRVEQGEDDDKKAYCVRAWSRAMFRGRERLIVSLARRKRKRLRGTVVQQ